MFNYIEVEANILMESRIHFGLSGRYENIDDMNAEEASERIADVIALKFEVFHCHEYELRNLMISWRKKSGRDYGGYFSVLPAQLNPKKPSKFKKLVREGVIAFIRDERLHS